MLVSATRLKILRSKYLLSLHGPKIVEKQCQNKPEILINIFILLSPCVFGRSKIWEANPLVPKTNNMPCQEIRFHLSSIIIQEKSKGLYQKGTNNVAVETNISSTTFTAFSFLLFCDYFSPVNIISNSFVSTQQMYMLFMTIHRNPYFQHFLSSFLFLRPPLE